MAVSHLSFLCVRHGQRPTNGLCHIVSFCVWLLLRPASCMIMRVLCRDFGSRCGAVRPVLFFVQFFALTSFLILSILDASSGSAHTPLVRSASARRFRKVLSIGTHPLTHAAGRKVRTDLQQCFGSAVGIPVFHLHPHPIRIVQLSEAWRCVSVGFNQN